MPRHTNLEDTILNYFSTAPLSEVQLMLKIITGAVKLRTPAMAPRKLSAELITRVRAQRRMEESRSDERLGSGN